MLLKVRAFQPTPQVHDARFKAGAAALHQCKQESSCLVPFDPTERDNRIFKKCLLGENLWTFLTKEVFFAGILKFQEIDAILAPNTY